MAGSDNILNILDFVAVNDGTFICTKAFNSAIISANKSGGGTGYVSHGTYPTGSIILKNNINLHLDAGTAILFSNGINDYPVIVSRWEVSERKVYQS